MTQKTIFFFIFLLLIMNLFPVAAEKKIEKAGYELDATIFSGLKLRNIGPALTSGRISDIAIHPRNPHTWYVAVGSGGVWKTINGGTTWQPVFDNQASYSTGCVTIAPNNPEIIYVGTGENVSGRHVGFGDGVYKSLNGGKTWRNMGLKKSEHISEILVDPRDSDVIFAAAEGPLWSPGGQRGLYKSSDGGRHWQAALKISQDTGVTSIAFEPGNPGIIYAAAYQRRRSVAAFMGGGPESGIYKSGDGGKRWQKLTVGLPKGHMGKIGLTVSHIKPWVVYATIEAGPDERGFYRSADRGESWEKRSRYISGGTGPHYYQEIYADPHRFDRIYQMDVWTHVTGDGGKNFRKVGEAHKHSDNHALAFHPTDPGVLLSGTDGGLYESRDSGITWKYFANLPVTQFYKIALDNAQPFYNIHGGAQDNGSQMGPSRTLNINGIMNRDWFFTYGADGYACGIDPEAPDIIYATWQAGHLLRYDRSSGETLDIQPYPGTGEDPPRWNWDSPFIISPHSHTRLYFGSQRLYRSDDRGDSWTTVSPDLSRGISRLEQEIMGRTRSVDDLWDHDAMSYFGNLTAISESPLQEGLLYAGTDDGLIRVSEDGGKYWRKIAKLPGIPQYFFVNDIKASLHNKDTVFAALDNHKTGDLNPYLVKSTDRGRTWTSIVGDLPNRHIVWAIEQDFIAPNLLFTGTEFGIFFTVDSGRHWLKLTGEMPTISFRDIEIQRRENDLVGASFGRGFFILDDYSPLRHITPRVLQREALLFPVKKALQFVHRRPFSLKGKGFQGDDFYIAPNPPLGAVFTYYLKDSLKTGKQSRRELEKKLEKQGKPVSFPGWDILRQEDREEKPAIIMTIKDEAGNLVRRITGPVTKGIHRVVWDLRYPPVNPTQINPRQDVEPWDEPPQGPLVVPGSYSVGLAKKMDGKVVSLGPSQSFEVESLGLQSLAAEDKQAVLAFQKKAGELQRVMMGTSKALSQALRQLEYIKKALLDTPKAEPALDGEIRVLEQKLSTAQMKLWGDRTLSERREPVSPSLIGRVSLQVGTTAAITATHKRNYEIAAAGFEKLLEEVRQLIEVDMKKLIKKVEAAGAPWTPGRGVPRWTPNPIF
jgi:photosystem II stability/assembly factor-like uncharacterized protein